MKSVLLLTVALDTYVVSRFKEECTKLGVELQVARYKDLSLSINNNILKLYTNKQELNIKNCDTVVCRNPSEGRSYHSEIKHLAGFLDYCKSIGLRVINGESIIKYSAMEDKLFQNLFFARNNIPTINTRHFNNSYDALDFFKNSHDLPKSPMLIKPRYGSQGKGVKLINNLQSLKRLIDYGYIENSIFQEFIPNDYDLRIIASKHEIWGAMKRSRVKGIINNFSAGGNVEDFTKDLTSELVDLSSKVVEAAQADYLGIDFIINKENNEVKLLEVNRFCQFTGFEKATAVNIPEKILSLI